MSFFCGLVAKYFFRSEDMTRKETRQPRSHCWTLQGVVVKAALRGTPVAVKLFVDKPDPQTASPRSSSIRAVDPPDPPADSVSAASASPSWQGQSSPGAPGQLAGLDNSGVFRRKIHVSQLIRLIPGSAKWSVGLDGNVDTMSTRGRRGSVNTNGEGGFLVRGAQSTPSNHVWSSQVLFPLLFHILVC